MKYTPCCSSRCLLGTCKTRNLGGCYCVCRLKDWEDTLMGIIEGRIERFGPGIVYNPNRIPVPLEAEELEKTTKELEEVRRRLKEYEI